jgi:hypothetical protein
MNKLIKGVVVLTLLAALLVPATVFADDTGTIGVTGDVPSTLTLTLPAGPIALSALTVGETKDSSAQEITVATNDPGGLTLKVRDNIQETTIGKMVSGENVLTNPLKVKGGDIASYTALSTEAAGTVLIKTNEAAEEITIADFSVQQQVLWDDPIDDGYSLTLYFIAANIVG